MKTKDINWIDCYQWKDNLWHNIILFLALMMMLFSITIDFAEKEMYKKQNQELKKEIQEMLAYESDLRSANNQLKTDIAKLDKDYQEVLDDYKNQLARTDIFIQVMEGGLSEEKQKELELEFLSKGGTVVYGFSGEIRLEGKNNNEKYGIKRTK